jgi:peptidoglycan/LPS O-acetylase OafA/YrhL
LIYHLNPKIDPLTSLRFFAAALIVLGHSSAIFGFPADWPRNLATYQGVTFFFVLSGFILTYAYPSIDGFHEVQRFAISRVARLWPAHFATFLLSIAILPWVPATFHTGFGKFAAGLNLTLLHAWVPLAASYFSFNGVSWSISVELFFYLNFLWLIKNIDSSWPMKLALALASAMIMMLIYHLSGTPLHGGDPFAVDGDSLIYISPFSRVFEFVLGMCAAVLFKVLRPGALSSLTIFWATVIETIVILVVTAEVIFCGSVWFELGPPSRLLPPELNFWLERAGSAPLYGLMIVVFAFQRGAIARVLSLPLFVLLGEISYSIYLLHQLLGTWARSHPDTIKVVPNIVGYLLYCTLTICGSYAMWRFVERPLRALITGGPKSFVRMLPPTRRV